MDCSITWGDDGLLTTLLRKQRVAMIRIPIEEAETEEREKEEIIAEGRKEEESNLPTK